VKEFFPRFCTFSKKLMMYEKDDKRSIFQQKISV
jgi:hypothetical protein